MCPAEPLFLEVALPEYCICYHRPKSSCFRAEHHPLWVLFLLPVLSSQPPTNLPDTPTHLQTSYPLLPSLPCSFSLSSSSSSVALGTGSPLPACCYLTVSAFTSPRQHTHFHRHAHTHTNAFWGLPQSEALKHIFPMLSLNKKDNLFAQPTSKSSSQPACQLLSHPVQRFSDTQAECPTAILAGQLAMGWTWSWHWAADGCCIGEWRLVKMRHYFAEFLWWKMLLAVHLKYAIFADFADRYHSLDWLDLLGKKQGPTSILWLVWSQ